MRNNINQHLPTIILVGRPNVGKSTLFNRLLKRRQAIEHLKEHTTRDVIREELVFAGQKAVILADSAGDDSATDVIGQQANQQRERFLSEAAAVVFVYDAVEGLTAADERILAAIRRRNLPFWIVANKADNADLASKEERQFNKEPERFMAVSAIHNLGISELRDRLAKLAVERQPKELQSVVVLGRPNAGKSTLFNALVKDAVSIVSDIPGTTRDVVSYETTLGNRQVRFLDTAGLSRRSKAMRGLQRFATMRIEESLAIADCVLLCIDAKEGIAVQDARLAGLALENKVSVVVVITKLDRLADFSEEQQDKILDTLSRDLRFLWWAPVVFVSAKTEQNLNELRQETARCLNAREVKIEQSILERVITDLSREHGAFSEVNSIEQIKQSPPTIMVTSKRPLHRTKLRQLANVIRNKAQLGPTPLVVRTADRVRAQTRGRYREEIV